METFAMLGEWWAKYYPIILTAGGTILTIASAVFVIWTKMQPILDKIKELTGKVDDIKTSDITSQLQLLDLETKITDLKSKIQNPTISDELKQQYITQLATLETFYAKMTAGLVTAEETISKY